MRRLILGLGFGALICAYTTTASAQKTGQAGFASAGCGLGSMVFGTDNTAWKQILAATTNGLFGSQTFGITSGTSNCTSAGLIKAEREQTAFAEVNFRDLKRDMAAGGGEFLSSFATLLGCEDTAKATLAKMTQTKYETLVPATTTTPVQMLSSIKAEIKATPALAGSCSDERALARAEGQTAPVQMSKSASSAIR